MYLAAKQNLTPVCLAVINNLFLQASYFVVNISDEAKEYAIGKFFKFVTVQCRTLHTSFHVFRVFLRFRGISEQFDT